MDWGPNNESQTRAFVRLAVGYRSERPRRHYELAVTLKVTGELIGGCGMEKRPIWKDAVLGYCFNKTYWGKGYATEAVRALLEFGFKSLALHRIFANCDPSNVASNRVLMKSGMKLEGHLRKNFRVKGGWRDTMIYGILEREQSSAR
jgi:RimJ/RimL family protein N-acetyltransferase